METPDANGFVTINWPSKNVPFGGVFHNRIVKTSDNDQKFLKVLLDESKLNNALRPRDSDKWENSLRGDKRQLKPKIQLEPQEMKPQYILRPRTPRRRSLSTIRETGAYDIDGYRPLKRGEDRDKLKERLQRVMAYGDSELQQPPQPVRRPKSPPKMPTAKDMRNELLTQIRERANWLAEMEELGEGANHRDIVHDQIAERIRALDALGIESGCSSARSSVSGFSTLRSREGPDTMIPPDNRAVLSAKTKSASSKASSANIQRSARSTTRSQAPKCYKNGPKKEIEEDVASYNNLPSLKYSPRRRC